MDTRIQEIPDFRDENTMRVKDTLANICKNMDFQGPHH